MILETATQLSCNHSQHYKVNILIVIMHAMYWYKRSKVHGLLLVSSKKKAVTPVVSARWP